MAEGMEAIELTYAPAGRNGTVTMTAKHGDNVLAVETLNLAKPKARDAFAESVCKDRNGITRAAVDAELLRLAAEVAGRKADKPTASGDPEEIDVRRMVRPELFITPDVSGITVPTLVTLGGELVGRWVLYLRWAKDRRESVALGKVLDLQDGGKLWIMPQPSPPSERMQAGWTAKARRNWLNGSAAVNVAELFHRLSERIAYFIDVPEDRAPGVTATLAIWTIFTYCYPAWDAVPYLYIGGPMGSGKSRVFEILARLAFRPFVSSNVTGPTVFRTLHNQGGVLLFDEAEQLKRSNDPSVGETLSVFLAGYKRGGQATRLEPFGDTFKLVTFDVYGPKALACIAGLPPALASRCITVTMFRAAKGSDKPRRRIDADPHGWSALRDDLHALALEHGPELLALADRSDVCPAMRGRDYELWHPILALAAWIESQGAKGLLKMMQKHAADTIDAGQDDATPDCDEVLLRTLADLLRIESQVKAGDVLDKAQEAEAAMFKGWSARAVAVHLKRYGVETFKTNGRKVYSDSAKSALRKVQGHYGIDLGYEIDAG